MMTAEAGRRADAVLHARGKLDEQALAAAITELTQRGGSRRRALQRDPGLAFAIVRGILGLPLVVADLSEEPAGRILRAALPSSRLTSRVLGHRALLEVPERPEDYSLGADKQTLRRKVRKAVKLGVTWRPLIESAERTAVLQRAEAWAEHAAFVDPGERSNDDLLVYDHWLAAYSAAGEPILLAITPIDADWALLRYFRSIGSGPEQSEARYLMMQVLVEDLARRGVRHLVDPVSPLDLPNGLQRFQRMIGFRLRRVRALPGGRVR